MQEPSAETGPPDAVLVAAAVGGDDRAFEQLLRRHESRVVRLLRLLGVPAQDREDVAQEVFVRVFRHLDGYERGRPFEAWLYRITVNAAHDERRRQTRRGRSEAAWPEEGPEPAAPAPGPDHRLFLRDRRERLERALEALSERERAVFVLCELEGLGCREVARVLAISSITVRRHLGRARRHLGKLLTPADREESAAGIERPASGRSM